MPLHGAARLIESSIKARGVRGPNSNGEYQICCPFCRSTRGKADEKFKLQYNPTKHVYHCYACEYSGHVDLPTLSNKLKTAQAALVAQVKPKADLGPPVGFHPFAQSGNANPLALEPYVKYMQKRGLYDQAAKVGAGGCLTGKYQGRVVFPLVGGGFSTRNQLGWRGFSARAIYPTMEPKYLYPAGMDRKNEVYGLDFIKTGELWLTEGVIDALALYPSGVATFGKNVTDEQIVKLAAFRVPVNICLDGDAWEEAMVLATRFALHGCDQVAWCKLPPQTDPGVLGWEVKKYLVRL